MDRCGSILHDTAKPSGVWTAISLHDALPIFYSQADCGGAPVAVANVGADEGDATADRSAASAALGAGSYSYKASVADNANYSADGYKSEIQTHVKLQRTVMPEVQDASHSDIT